MKIFLNFLMILFSTIAFSQFLEHKPPNNDWDIYPETNISYPKGKEDLKEILALQALLAEDRVDEMFKMIGEFGYIPIPDSENGFWKNTINNTVKENEMEPIFFIKNLGSNTNFYENYLHVVFTLIVKDNLTSVLSRKLKVNYKQAARMNNLFYKLLPLGNNYKSLKNTWNESMGLGKGMSMNWVDRYTIKVTNPNGAPNIYKASNFSTPPPFFEKKDGQTTIIFSGPGKAYNTKLYIRKLSSINSNKTSEYFTPSVTFLSSVSDMFKTFKPISRKPFNFQFFMSLENFNDRIWSDK